METIDYLPTITVGCGSMYSRGGYANIIGIKADGTRVEDPFKINLPTYYMYANGQRPSDISDSMEEVWQKAAFAGGFKSLELNVIETYRDDSRRSNTEKKYLLNCPSKWAVLDSHVTPSVIGKGKDAIFLTPVTISQTAEKTFISVIEIKNNRDSYNAVHGWKKYTDISAKWEGVKEGESPAPFMGERHRLEVIEWLRGDWEQFIEKNLKKSGSFEPYQAILPQNEYNRVLAMYYTAIEQFIKKNNIYTND